MDRLSGLQKCKTICLFVLSLGLLAFVVACGDDDDGGDDDGGAEVRVTTAEDNDGRDGEISLREALSLIGGNLKVGDLEEAEAEKVDGEPGAASADTVLFDFEEAAVIELSEALPALHGVGDTIDASGKGVTIDGSAAAFICLDLASSENAVYGLRFVGCRTAVRVPVGVSGNVIGGPGAGQGNVFLDGGVGIEIAGRGTVVQGNHIGVEPNSAEPRGTEFEGIWLASQARDNRIGGPGEGEGNIVSGNLLYGISIDGARGTVVQGNYIGLDTTGRVGVRNDGGVVIQNGAFGNLVGGGAEGESNVISANRFGVLLTGPETTGNTVQGNLFGTSVGQGEGIPNAEDIYEDAGVGDNEFIDNILPP
jgi:hypothetical protein